MSTKTFKVGIIIGWIGILLLIIILSEYIFPLSTLFNYAEGAEVNIFFNRDDVINYYMNQSGLTLYNVEPQWGFAYFTLGCDYEKQPKCTLENRSKKP